MQIYEITRRPLAELVATPTATTGQPPGFNASNILSTIKPSATAPAASGSAPAPKTAPAATTAPAASSGSAGRLAKMSGAVSNSLPGKVIGGTAAVAGGIAGALGKSLMSKAFGGVDVTGKFAGQPMNRAQALKLGQEMSKTLLPVLQQNWAGQVQAALAQSRDPVTKAAPTSAAKLTAGEKSVLKSQLTAMVNQAIQPRGNFNYTTLANYVGDDATPEGQTVKATALKTVQEINSAIEGIFQSTIAGTNPAQDWQKLVTAGIVPAQGVLAFDAGQGTVGGTGVTGLSSQTQQLANAAKFDNAEVAALQQAIKRNNITAANDPRIVELLGLSKAAE